jgi:hypothetical protein
MGSTIMAFPYQSHPGRVKTPCQGAPLKIAVLTNNLVRRDSLQTQLSGRYESIIFMVMDEHKLMIAPKVRKSSGDNLPNAAKLPDPSKSLDRSFVISYCVLENSTIKSFSDIKGGCIHAANGDHS